MSVLVSTYRRHGEPVMVACGPTRTGSGLRVGLLFTAAHLDLDRVTLAPLSGEGPRVTIHLPPALRDLPADRFNVNADLEVTA